jgi:hypothetical protein
MPLSTLIQLHILLAMTPALAGWMLATPSHPMLARAMGVAIVQIRHIDPDRIERSGQTRSAKRTVSASILRICRRYLQRTANRAITCLPAPVAVLSLAALSPSLARAP